MLYLEYKSIKKDLNKQKTATSYSSRFCFYRVFNLDFGDDKFPNGVKNLLDVGVHCLGCYYRV